MVHTGQENSEKVRKINFSEKVIKMMLHFSIFEFWLPWQWALFCISHIQVFKVFRGGGCRILQGKIQRKWAGPGPGQNKPIPVPADEKFLSRSDTGPNSTENLDFSEKVKFGCEPWARSTSGSRARSAVPG